MIILVLFLNHHSIRSQAHHFIFRIIDGKSKIGRNSAVQQTDRMGKMKFCQHLYFVALSYAISGSRPFSHPIQSNNSRFLKRREKESASRMRLVVINKMYPSSIIQLKPNSLLHIQFFLSPRRKELCKSVERKRSHLQMLVQNTLKF